MHQRVQKSPKLSSQHQMRQFARSEVIVADTLKKDALRRPNSEDINRRERDTGVRAVFRYQWKSLLLLVLSWSVLLLYLRASTDEGKIGGHATTEEESRLPPQNLHLIIPASKTDPNLCKVMVSAAIAGYPAPVLINWGKEFNDAELVEGGSHLAKITGVYSYLSSIPSAEDESLVLMVDGFDVWMQLRPQTLIDRYFKINKRANERLTGALGSPEVHGIRQEILFGCQKRCWPWTVNDPPCYAVPHSTLPNDIYGPKTDTDTGDEGAPYTRYRQRFLNSGVAIGTVRAMRKLFQQALVLLETEQNIGSDQWIFSHIFGDQEVWREAVRLDNLGVLGRAREKLWGPNSELVFNPTHIDEVRAKAAERDDKSFEFGIGLDYGSEIGLNTVFAEDDTAWLNWSDRHQIRLEEMRLGILPSKSRMGNLTTDISDTVPPFWTFSNEDLPRWRQWQDVQLFTNIWTGTVPAVIHHNAHRDGRKSLRETWWDSIWFYKYARLLYDVSVYEPILPVAYSGYTEETQRAWWPAERWKGGGRNGSSAWRPEKPSELNLERWVPFEDICREYHEEVFRDGKGPWQLPIVH